MKQFIQDLLSAKNKISSNRFMGIFIFSPLLIFITIAKYPIEYIYAVIGLIVSLLITNAVAKFTDKEIKN